MQQLVNTKEAARTAWGTGDYDAMMRFEGLYEVGARLVRRIGVRPGEDVLDVACGTGNAAIPAARSGARVTGLDLTPEMLDVARRRAEEAGAHVDWRVGDAEALPFDDGRFDVVLSTFGCMFAPRHEIVADELGRVLRPGGRLGLVTWTPEGVIGEFFRTVAAYQPPDPEFVDPPLAFGDADHVTELFEGTGIAVEFAYETWPIEHRSPQDAIDCYTANLGPVVLARRLTEHDGRWPRLRDDLTRLFEAHSDGTGVHLPAEYLVTVGNKTEQE